MLLYLLISAVPINVAFMGMGWRRRHHSISESVGRNRDDILPPKYLYELERDYAWLTVMLWASFEKFQKLIRMACGVATIRRLTLSTLIFQEPT